MFGDLLGNVEKQQAEVRKKLSAIVLSETFGGVTVTGNAARQIQNVEISDTLISENDKEQLEDSVLTCFNRLLDKIAQAEAVETQRLMQEMLPPGFGDLFGK
ncbi:MAG: YbaB/EbfC family nucleoid-associated protein [Saprospiraceae bacterium]|nr:YbaB/EbfC family nucleoid-associated protein [Saprospiraceae bacterium]